MIRSIVASPKYDESIHSFFLRIMLRAGLEDFTTIITLGGWGETPSIPYDVRHELNNYSVYFLFELFEKQFHLENCQGLFDNRLSYIHLFNEAFFPDKKKSFCGSRLPLRFCLHCIEEQLLDEGFTYFKLDWLSETFCNVHFTPLHKIRKGLSFSKTRDTLKSITLAEWNEISDFISIETLHPTVFGKKSSSDDFIEKTSVCFAPCAKKDLIKYFMNRMDYYPKGCFSVADYGFLSEIQRKMCFSKNKRSFLEKQLEDAYEYELENNYSFLMEFCNKAIEINKVSCFDIDYWVMKSNSKKCLDCVINNSVDSKSCPAMDMISYPAKVFFKQENICDKYLYDLEMRVEFYQNRLRVNYGERFVWGSIEKSRAIHYSGGLDSYRKRREIRLKLAAKALVDL